MRVKYYATTSLVDSHIHTNQLADRRLLNGVNIEYLLSKMHIDYKKVDYDRYVRALFVLIDSIAEGLNVIYITTKLR